MPRVMLEQHRFYNDFKSLCCMSEIEIPCLESSALFEFVDHNARFEIDREIAVSTPYQSYVQDPNREMTFRLTKPESVFRILSAKFPFIARMGVRISDETEHDVYVVPVATIHFKDESIAVMNQQKHAYDSSKRLVVGPSMIKCALASYFPEPDQLCLDNSDIFYQAPRNENNRALCGRRIRLQNPFMHPRPLDAGSVSRFEIYGDENTCTITVQDILRLGMTNVLSIVAKRRPDPRSTR
jgi:hypothetical protein